MQPVSRQFPLCAGSRLVSGLRFEIGNACVSLALLVIACSTASAQLTNVTVQQFDGSSITGSIDSIDADGTLFGNGLPGKLNLRDVLAIETSLTVERKSEFNVAVQLVLGGQLLVRNPAINAETLQFESAAGINQIPLQSMRGIVWQNSTSVEQLLAAPSKAEDTVFVETAEGERQVSGIIESLDQQKLQLDYQNESRSIGVAKIRAVVMADLGLPAPSGSLATVQLSDGSTVVGVIAQLIAGTLSLQTQVGQTIALESSRIIGISIRSDRQQFLSDLQPVDVQQRTEFAAQRSWRPDRSVENNRLSIRLGKSDQVVEFNKGLGTQAFTQLDFANVGEFATLRATVGIDAETLGRGDCQMVVRGDGIELWSRQVRGSDEPHEINLKIDGISTISLVVYPGADFDLADHADWGNARFAK